MAPLVDDPYSSQHRRAVERIVVRLLEADPLYRFTEREIRDAIRRGSHRDLAAGLIGTLAVRNALDRLSHIGRVRRTWAEPDDLYQVADLRDELRREP
jgi:hypothetical protein